MKQITPDQALINYCQNPICKKGLTIFNLIIYGVITYDEWLEALYVDTDPYDYYVDQDHRLAETKFGRKVLAFIQSLGYDTFMFAYKYRRRTDDHELESIRFINQKLKLSIWREEGEE